MVAFTGLPAAKGYVVCTVATQKVMYSIYIYINFKKNIACTIYVATHQRKVKFSNGSLDRASFNERDFF
jgi:hypothetical protein